VFYLSLIPEYIFSRRLRARVDILAEDANQPCFEREILDHFRLVFEKA